MLQYFLTSQNVGFFNVMEHEAILSLALFGAFFFALITTVQKFCDKFTFPYTVALLLVGILGQLFITLTGIESIIRLSPEIIFYFLLPALLFEASMHINLHQFRLQFKTISFLASFGLLISVFVIGLGVSIFVGLPIGVALLFGALISATDPIAVLSLFKTLGAPKRLALLADGESMFNDATGVIAFRIVSLFVLTQTAFSSQQVLNGLLDFAYVFVGSLILGTILGYGVSRLLTHIKHDRILVNTITASLAIGSFTAAEHYFHLSGVITTVMAGITLGNVGRNKLPVQIINFIEEFWEFISFVSVSLVFFIASFDLNFNVFFGNLPNIGIIILVVLLGRSISVYLSSFITNKTFFFKDEPNIPVSWQHILNWGGLRGVIPLVLVYSLPDGFIYKQEILAFTLATLLFTLLVNGLTIKWLLVKLKLNVPEKEEEIISDEMKLFELEKRKERLQDLPTREFSPLLIQETMKRLEEKEHQLKTKLTKSIPQENFLKSLKIQSLEIERETLHELFYEGRFDENVFYYFESELDLQFDAIEYPKVYPTRLIEKGGYIHTTRSYRKRLVKLKQLIIKYPILNKLFNITTESIIEERYELLRARLFTSYAVMDYLNAVESYFAEDIFKKMVREVRRNQQSYIKRNLEEANLISKQHPRIVENYQRRIIRFIIQEGKESINI